MKEGDDPMGTDHGKKPEGQYTIIRISFWEEIRRDSRYDFLPFHTYFNPSESVIRGSQTSSVITKCTKYRGARPGYVEECWV